MKRAGKPATYGLTSSRDLLEKLEWELDRLKEASNQNPTDPTDLYFHAFNAAVTAWHIADWVWRDMTPDQRKKLEIDWDVNLCVNDEEGGAFRGNLRKKDRDIAICREIATASKHVNITRGRDETIETVASAKTTSDHDSEAAQIQVNGTFVTTTVWKLKVADHGNRRDLVDVFDKAFKFWVKFVNDRGIAK